MLEQMKLTRWVGSLIYNTNVNKNHRKEPHRLYPLPEIDVKMEEKKLKLPTKAEMDEMFNWPNARKLDNTTIEEVLNQNKK